MDCRYLSLVLLALLNIAIGTAPRGLLCPSAIVGFGDSLTDTGNHKVAFPSQSPLKFSNGRMSVEFLAQALDLSLDYYLNNVGANFTTGVNFAYAGATARNYSDKLGEYPFYFHRQLDHYYYFDELIANNEPGILPSISLFPTALHWISIGINDFLRPLLFENLTLTQIESDFVPAQTVLTISQGIQRLYGYGARTFLVFNIPALGCIPLIRNQFNSSALDDAGCLTNYNKAAKAYNTLLKSSLVTLRQQMPDAVIMLADYYQILVDVVSDPAAHGFDPLVKFQECESNVFGCAGYISWDGIHFTEQFNKVVIRKLTEGHYVNPWPLSAICDFDYSKF